MQNIWPFSTWAAISLLNLSLFQYFDSVICRYLFWLPWQLHNRAGWTLNMNIESMNHIHVDILCKQTLEFKYRGRRWFELSLFLWISRCQMWPILAVSKEINYHAFPWQRKIFFKNHFGFFRYSYMATTYVKMSKIRDMALSTQSSILIDFLS